MGGRRAHQFAVCVCAWCYELQSFDCLPPCTSFCGVCAQVLDDLLCVNDAMLLILWMRLFLQAQGFNVKDNVVYQDNQSAILLENNGKRLSSKNTKHIDIRYFFITDNIRRKQMRVEYCPTEIMRGDFMTKHLQGTEFCVFRQQTLNLPDHLAGI